ncbi:MAG TPA: hypothetical protein PLU99_07125, partial [Phycisphaerae bacterium]|nr:hypothetical protein [Phycisphaerae bacterium]
MSTQAQRVRAEQRPPAGTSRAEKQLSWWTRGKFGLVRWFLFAWARLFSLKGLYLFGCWFATAEYLINFKRRRRYWRELQGVFPE